MWHSLGKIIVAAAGTPVRVTNNQTTPNERIGCQTIFVQQLPTNTGCIYICDRATANKTTGAGILAIIPAPTLVDETPVSLPCGAGTIPTAAAPFNAADFYIDADVNGDGAIISYLTG